MVAPKPRAGWLGLALAAEILGCGAAEEQSAGPVIDSGRDRAAYVSWLENAPTSPMKAVSRLPLIDSITLGPPTSDLPLDGDVERTVVLSSGVARLRSDSGERTLAPYVPVSVGRYHLSLQGERERPILMAFGTDGNKTAATFYPIDSGLMFDVFLERGKRRPARMLALDGIEVEGTIVGHVVVPLGKEGRTRLEVRHVPDPGTEESSLEIYFRDETNSEGSYPSGRFVPLIPQRQNRYLLDFNRARNPFCAYSTVYPCPVPWRGNMIESPVEAGERYQSASLD